MFNKKTDCEIYKPKYKVTSIFKNDGIYYVKVRNVIGASILGGHIKEQDLFCNEILSSDDMTNSFSQCDVRTITYLATKNILEKHVDIIKEKISPKGEKAFLIYDKSTKNIEFKLLDELTSDMTMISKLSPNDAFKLGKMAHEKEMSNNKKEINSIKKK